MSDDGPLPAKAVARASVRSIGSTIAYLALAAILAGLALAIREPVVFAVRHVLAPTLVIVAAVAAVAALSTRRNAAAALLAGCAALAVWQGAASWLDRAVVLGRTDALALAVERHFVVGFGDPASARELVLDGHAGGLFLTRRNVAGRLADDLAGWIAKLQEARRDAGLPPLVVAADQEGGSVSHMSPPLAAPPALASLTDVPEPLRRRAAERLGAEVGAGLHAIGVTLDLAPVADLKPAVPPTLLDLHTRIATRAISADPSVVADIATGFSRGLLNAHVIPTAKHFPGLGRVAADTHLASASLGATTRGLDGDDWLPFHAVLALPGAAVMLSHVSLDAVEPGVPASQSKSIVEGLLRGTWHFGGIAITDDLSMGAVVHGGLCKGVEGALNAGIDLLLVSWDTDAVYTAMRCAIDAADAGRLDLSLLAASAHRLDEHADRRETP